MKKIRASVALAALYFVISGFLYLGVWWHATALESALALSFLILGVTELVFRTIIYQLLLARVHTTSTRYNLNKALVFLHLTTALVLILWIWLPNSGTMLAAYGFVAAALAFALQDLFRDIVGGMVIVLRNLYRVGDRVTLGTTSGDVIDIGLLYTTVLELGGWIGGDQVTGRLVRWPNGQVLTNNVYNYTADHNFIWDELRLTVTASSDWATAEHILHEVLEASTRELSATAMQELHDLQEQYFLTEHSTEPRVYIEAVAGGVQLSGRYMVDTRQRRTVRSTIMHTVLERLAHEKHIQLV